MITEATKFLDALRRQCEYRRTQRDADPLVAQEASKLELYLKERMTALKKTPAPKAQAV